MTRKQRQGGGGNNVTYDLSNPRNIAAFEALLDEEEDEDPRQQPPRGKRSDPPKKREKEKFFKLKADMAAQAKGSKGDAAAGGAQQQDQLKQLIDMFKGSAEPAIIADVFTGTGGNYEATVDALLSMLGGAAETAPAGPSAVPGASSSRAAAASSGGYLQDSIQPLPIAWADLPSDVKLAILSNLPLRDLACAASTCREFCDRASHMRRHVHRLLLPAGLSYSGLVGMVSGYGAANVVDMSRTEKHISRLNPDEMMPQVVALRKQEAEANVFKSVLAVAEGAVAPGRQQPVVGLVLRGLVGATDRVIAEALANLKGLRSLDLSHCPNVTNKSLHLLAKYKATDYQQSAQTEDDFSSDDIDYEQYARANGYSSSEKWEKWQEEELEEPYNEEQQDTLVERQQQQQQTDASAITAAASAAAAAAGGDGAGSSLGNDVSQTATPAAAAAAAAAAAMAREKCTAHTAATSTGPGDLAVEQATLQATTPPADTLPTAALTYNPAIHDPINTAVDSAVTNRMAALQLRASQQAAAAAAAVAEAAGLGLTELRLAGNRGFADDGLRQVLQGPVIKHSLAVLDISGCKGLSAAGLVIPPLGVLRELRASHLQSLTQVVIHMPASHPLTDIDLSGCHYLRVVDLALNNLKQLDLNACRTLYRLRMRCPALTNLSLAQCGMLHEFHTDAWQVPALQHLNLFGCRRASGAMLQPVLGTLPELRSLCLNGCWSIHSLHLTVQLQLESCDITGCRSLVAFSSSSPCLTALTASACGRLYSLTLASTCLQSLQLANCGQLSEVFVAAAAPPPPPPRAAGSGSSAAVKAGERNRAVQSGGSGSASVRRAAAAGQGGVKRGLNVNGCSMLSEAAKARLAAAVGYL